MILSCDGGEELANDTRNDDLMNVDSEGEIVNSSNSRDSFVHDALLGCNVSFVERDDSSVAAPSKVCEARANEKQPNVVVGLSIAAWMGAGESQVTYASNDYTEPIAECHVGSPRDGGRRTKNESASVVRKACGMASASREADTASVVVASETCCAFAAAVQSHMSVGVDDFAVAEHKDRDGFEVREHCCPDQRENEEETATAHETCEMEDESAQRLHGKCDIAQADLDATLANLERDDDLAKFSVGLLEDTMQPRSAAVSTCVEETPQTALELVSTSDEIGVLVVADNNEYSNTAGVGIDVLHPPSPDDFLQHEDPLGSEHLSGCNMAFVGDDDSLQALTSAACEASVTRQQPCVLVGPSMLKPQLCRAAPVATGLLVANTLFIISLLCVNALLCERVLR